MISAIQSNDPGFPACGPAPSLRQLAWHSLEFYGFVHFTINTFTDKEWGYGDEDPALFNPTALDAHQWAAVAKDAGMRGLILTCKHHDGFCLWPSRFTERSVRNSPWRNGKGDVVREVSDACAAAGLKFGIYLSPWDCNHADYGCPGYVTYYRNQLRELLTKYGEIFEVWFDGANGGRGYYGGAREHRKIDAATYYEWSSIHALVRELQPNAVMFSDVGPDIRWVGNETGTASETSWCRFDTTGRYPGFPRIDDLGCGHEDGPLWLPPEVDVSIRPGWFYHPREDRLVRTPANLLELYYRSVGRCGNLLLNLPPDRRGLIPETDVRYLRDFRRALDAVFARNLALDSRVSASNQRLNHPAFAPAHAVYGPEDAFWAVDDGVLSATLELVFLDAAAFNTVVLGEPIAFGQRIKAWTLCARSRGTWVELARGTTIGRKRIVRVKTAKADAVRLTIREAKAPPALCIFGIYGAPSMLVDPEIHRDPGGAVTINAGDGARVRYTCDSSPPDARAPLYAGPFALLRGGRVRAAALPDDNPDTFPLTSVPSTERRFGLCKGNWRIIHTDSEEMQEYNGRAANAIDDNSATMWHTRWTGETPGYPHELVIDLGAETVISAFGYLPRQDGNTNAIVAAYEFYTSQEADQWGEPAASGHFDNIINSPTERVVEFPQPRRARYVRFVALASANDSPSASAVEINVYTRNKPRRGRKLKGD